MKLFIYILVLVSSVNPLVFSQTIDLSFYRTIQADTRLKWQKNIHSKPFVPTPKLLSSLDKHCNCRAWGKEGAASWNDHSMYWVDLNNNQKSDLIFSGGCMPYAATCLFIRQGDSLKLLKKYTGVITQLRSDSNATHIAIRSDACCCSMYSGVFLATIAHHSDTLLDRKEVFWYGEMPLEEPTFFKPLTTKKKAHLRYSPVSHNKVKSWECDSSVKIKGNITAVFKPGTPVMAIAQKSKNGKVWYFVIVPPNHNRVSNRFEMQQFDPLKTYSMGWIERSAFFE